MLRIAAALAVLAAALPASADEVVLRNGRTLSGIAREDGNRIVIETTFGTVAYPRDEVVSIERGETPLHEYAAKLDAVKDSKDVRDWESLLAYAKEQKLSRYVAGLCGKILELDPSNVTARRELKLDRPEPAKPAPDANAGKILHEGKWLLPLELEILKAKELDSAEKAFSRATVAAPRQDEKKKQDEKKDARKREPAKDEKPKPVAKRAEDDYLPQIDEIPIRPLGIPGAEEFRIRPLGIDMTPVHRPVRRWVYRRPIWYSEDIWGLYFLNRALGSTGSSCVPVPGPGPKYNGPIP